ncbi:hypothetical protein OSTOST_17118, partial [Ostertagia ostertagi]
MLGVNDGEHIILYSRDDRGGMEYSTKFSWLLKARIPSFHFSLVTHMSYGHEKSSVLDGGFALWEKKGLEISTEDVQLPAGTWKAKDNIAPNNIKYEELRKEEGGKQYIERTDEVNFLDARIRGQFNGTEDTGMDVH